MERGVVGAAFGKGRMVKYVTVVLALFSVVFAGQFGLESMQTLHAGFSRPACVQARAPQSGVRIQSQETSHSSGPHLRPKYVRSDTADLPPLAIFCRISFGRVFHAEDRPTFLFSRRFEVQGPRPPPTIS